MKKEYRVKNLWGDLPIRDYIRTPYVILKEQASILTTATNRLLIGRVIKEHIPKHPDYPNNCNFDCILEIQVPSVNNYSIAIVSIEYPNIFYPAKIYNLLTDSSYKECDSEEDIDRNLEEILSSREVKRVVLGLLSEVRLDKAQQLK